MGVWGAAYLILVIVAMLAFVVALAVSDGRVTQMRKRGLLRPHESAHDGGPAPHP